MTFLTVFKVFVAFIAVLHTDPVYGQGPPCTGQTLGEASPTLTGVTAGTNTGFSYTFLDTSMKVPCCGVISEWRFATKAAGDLTAQVWRQSAGNVYTNRGDKAVTVAADRNMVISVGASEQVSVEQNDYIGWHSSATDIVPYLSTGSAVMGRVSQSGKTAKGSTATWAAPLTNGEQWMFGAVLSEGATPSFGSSLPQTVTAQTSDAVGTVLHTLTPTDDNPDDIDTLTVSLTSAEFEYDTTTKAIKTKAALSAQTYLVEVKVVDHCLLTGTATLTVTVTDDKPVITSLPIAAAILREDAGDAETQTPLHTLVVTDDGPLTDVTCSMTKPAGAPFELKYIAASANYGVFYSPSGATPLNYDVTPLYQMYVTCNDGSSDSDTREFQVSIEPNAEPVLDLPTNIDVDAETTTDGMTVYTAVATDTDGKDLRYTMNCTGCPFAMKPNGELYAPDSLNTHRDSPYDVTITVEDGYNNVTKTITLTITNINHPPNVTIPTKVAPEVDDIHIDEHTDEGTPNAKGTTIDVITVAGFDEDADTLTFEFDTLNGQGENFFNFDENTGLITTKQDLDYETLSDNGLLTTTVYVRAFDGREYSETRILNIIVDDVNETPEFTQNKYSIETGETTATTTLPCALFAVIDEDKYDTRTYDIDCGATGHFHIPSTRGSACDAYIVQTAEDDQDNPGRAKEIVTCTITVTDKGGLTATTTLEITVHEEDDNPPVLDKTSYTYSIPNDTTAGTYFGNVDTTDADFLAKHKYHTLTTDSSEFKIDANGRFVSTRDWTNVNAPVTRTFTVTATDDAGHTDTAPVTVTIYDVPTTTTSTTTTTVIPSVYSGISSFMDDPGNLAWLIPAILLGLLALGLLGFMLFRCCMNPGMCASMFRACGGGRCCNNGPRRIGNVRRAAPPPRQVVERRPQRVVEMARPKRVVEVIEVQRQRPPTLIREVEAPPPKQSSGFFDCFKGNKSTPTPNKPNIPEPLNANEGKPFKF